MRSPSGASYRLDDYPVLDDGLYEREQQDEIDASWDAWVKHDFRRSLEKRFGRDVREDADLSQLFYESEPEWNEDSSGMYCNIERCVAGIEPEDAEPYLVAA